MTESCLDRSHILQHQSLRQAVVDFAVNPASPIIVCERLVGAAHRNVQIGDAQMRRSCGAIEADLAMDGEGAVQQTTGILQVAEIGMQNAQIADCKREQAPIASGQSDVDRSGLMR